MICLLFPHTDETLPADVVQPNNGQDSDNTVTVQFDPSEFTEPGIYKYGVSETTVDEAGNPITYEGITNDEAFMYVYVEEAGLDKDGTMQYKITNVVLTHQDTVLGKIGQLTNRYGVDPDKDPDGTVNDLILTKKVTGNQGIRRRSLISRFDHPSLKRKTRSTLFTEPMTMMEFGMTLLRPEDSL